MKVCKLCGEDCSTRPRVKDAEGSYYCRTCHAAAVEQREEREEREAMAALDRNAERASNAHDAADSQYGLAEDTSSRPAKASAFAKQCANCGAEVEPNAEICTNCGMILASGKRVETEVDEFED